MTLNEVSLFLHHRVFNPCSRKVFHLFHRFLHVMRLHRVWMATHLYVLMTANTPLWICHWNWPISVVNLNRSTKLKLRTLFRCLNRCHFLARSLTRVFPLLHLDLHLLILLMLDDSGLRLWDKHLLVLLLLYDRSSMASLYYTIIVHLNCMDQCFDFLIVPIVKTLIFPYK